VNLWYNYVSGIFLRSYIESVSGFPFIPGDKGDLEVMLKVYLLEKAVYELGYELNSRPEWVIIPLRGIRDLMEDNGLHPQAQKKGE